MPKYIVLFVISTWSLAWNFITPEGSYQRLGRMNVLLLGIFSLLSFKLWKEWSWEVGVFFLYLCLRYMWNGMPIYSSLDIFLVGGCLFFIPYIYAQVRLYTFEYILVVTSIVHAIIGVFNIFGMHLLKITNPVYLQGHMNWLPVGLLGQETLLSPYLIWGGFVAIIRKYYFWGLFFLTIGLMTKSAMGFASFLAGAFVLFLHHKGRDKWWLILPAGCFGGLALMFNPEFFTLSGRAIPWSQAYNLILQNPWFGYGSGSWKIVAVNVAKATGGEAWLQLHSDVLQGFFELGVLGMAPVIVLVLRLLYVSFMKLHEIDLLPYIIGFLVFGVNAFGNFPLRIVPHGPLFLLCLYVVLKKKT